MFPPPRPGRTPRARAPRPLGTDGSAQRRTPEPSPTPSVGWEQLTSAAPDHAVPGGTHGSWTCALRDRAPANRPHDARTTRRLSWSAHSGLHHLAVWANPRRRREPHRHGRRSHVTAAAIMARVSLTAGRHPIGCRKAALPPDQSLPSLARSLRPSRAGPEVL